MRNEIKLLAFNENLVPERLHNCFYVSTNTQSLGCIPSNPALHGSINCKTLQLLWTWGSFLITAWGAWWVDPNTFLSCCNRKRKWQSILTMHKNRRPRSLLTNLENWHISCDDLAAKTFPNKSERVCSIPRMTVHHGKCCSIKAPAFWKFAAPSHATKSNKFFSGSICWKILFFIPSGIPSPHCYPNNTTFLRLCLNFEDTFILLSPHKTTQ